jgi:hypothetical protein
MRESRKIQRGLTTWPGYPISKEYTRNQVSISQNNDHFNALGKYTDLFDLFFSHLLDLLWMISAMDLERNGRECALKRKTRSLHEIWGSWGSEKGLRPRVSTPSVFIELLCIVIDHEAYVV